MPTLTSPVITMHYFQHTFHFDTTFREVHLPSNCELRFFSETLSLIDSMKNIDLLHSFVQRMRKTKGVLTCEDLIDLLKEENLVDSDEEGGLQFLLDNIYRIINRIVTDKFVSCMHTSSLGCVAWEVGQLYVEQSNNNDEDPKTSSSVSPDHCYLKEKSHIWIELSERLRDLAQYQHKSLKIHHDFQKSNYAPDPRSKYAYGSTFAIIFIGFFYLLLKSVKLAEAKELMSLLRK